MNVLIGIVLIIIVTIILSPIITVFGIPIVILGCGILIILSIWEIYNYFINKKEIKNNILKIEKIIIYGGDYKGNKIVREEEVKLEITDKALVFKTVKGITNEILTGKSEKFNYIFKIEDIKSLEMKKNTENTTELILELQNENTKKLFHIELQQKKNVLNLIKNIDIVHEKLKNILKNKNNEIYYEKMDLLKLVSMKKENILNAKEILLDKCIELRAVLNNISEETWGTEIRLSEQKSKKYSAKFVIKDEKEKEKIKKYKIGDEIIINGVLEDIFEGIYYFRDVIIGKIKIEKKDEEKILENKYLKENLKQEETIEDSYEQLKSKIDFLISSMKVFIYNAKEWFNSLKNFQKIILLFLILLSIGINFYTRNSILGKEKEIKEAQKKYDEAIEKNKNILNENEKYNSEEKPIATKENTDVNNNVEETGTIEDIKNEIKSEIKEQARNEGIQLTDEQIDKLALYKMQKNMIENLQNDPELRREVENAINDSN
mgnify:CR=1 FL=1